MGQHGRFQEDTAQPFVPSNETKRILIAEDDPDQRDLMRAFLKAEGFEVFVCGDGRRGMEIFQARGDIDLLIADLQMPHVTGLELALGLSTWKRDLPVMIVSGYTRTPEQQLLMEERGWMFFQKPFTVPQMLSAIHELFSETTPHTT